jgi:holo-[acyl-carrier protein] synthase
VAVIGGLGLDVVEIERVRRLLANKGERALVRLFTSGERRYCESKPDPVRHFAVRIAAKEAAFKALSGTAQARAIGWREIEVRVDAAGCPAVELHGAAARRATQLDVFHVWLSLSHTDAVAAAVVVLEVRR